MFKFLGMLAALAIWLSLPAVAFGTCMGGVCTPPGPQGDTISSGNTQSGDVDQSASARSGGNAGNQAALVQQNAGDDAIADVNQSQNFRTGGAVTGVRFHGHGGRFPGGGVDGVGGRGVGGAGGAGVQNVKLARTGFPVWILAILAGAALGSGEYLLARRRRPHRRN